MYHLEQTLHHLREMKNVCLLSAQIEMIISFWTDRMKLMQNEII